MQCGAKRPSCCLVDPISVKTRSSGRTALAAPTTHWPLTLWYSIQKSYRQCFRSRLQQSNTTQTHGACALKSIRYTLKYMRPSPRNQDRTTAHVPPEHSKTISDVLRPPSNKYQYNLGTSESATHSAKVSEALQRCGGSTARSRAGSKIKWFCIRHRTSSQRRRSVHFTQMHESEKQRV